MSTENVTETTNQTAEAVGIALDRFDNYMQSVGEIITEYGGEAVNLGLTVLRIDAAANLAIGFLLLTIAYVLFKKVMPWCVLEYRKATIAGATRQNILSNKDIWDDKLSDEIKDMFGSVEVFDQYQKKFEQDAHTFPFVGSILSALVGICMLIASLFYVANIWYWVGIFYPEAYAVYKFLL